MRLKEKFTTRNAAAFLAMLAATVGANAQWTVINLHPAGANESRAYGVSGGQQVGHAHVGGLLRASLWSGTASSWVNLNPAGSTYSYATGVGGGQQVGVVTVGGLARASLWSGTAASWVDLNPAGSTYSYAYGVSGGQQVGYAYVGGQAHAILWSGTAASMVDLNAFVPAGFSDSIAHGISHDAFFTYVVGYGFNTATQRTEALMWVARRLPSPPKKAPGGSGPGY